MSSNTNKLNKSNELIMRPSLQEKINYSIHLLKSSEKIALMYNQNGFWLAFSGGKDSQVIYHLAKMAGVKFHAHMNPTTIDPPEVLKFVRKQYPDVVIEKPKISIYDLAVKKHLLPTMLLRWCCKEYKEIAGAGYVTIIGIRRQESARRSKRNEIEFKNHKFSGSFDEFVINQETQVGCVSGKEKVMLSPIIEWSERDVWEFLNSYNIPHCKLYDEGRKRIGCILCPMSSYKNKIMDLKKYPYVREKWIQAIKQIQAAGYCNQYAKTPDALFDWWISGKNIKKWYSDNYQQLDIWEQKKL